MSVDGYIRVSRVAGRGGESFISPTEQRRAVESYAEARGWTIDQWHEDLDVSGVTIDRPELAKALERCRRGETGGIVAAKLDRLSRSLADLSRLVASAQDEGWTLVAVDHGLDLKTPGGQLVANILGAVAEWELGQRRETWNRSQARAVERGVHVASRTPTGYRKRDDGRLEPDPLAAPVVQELFARRARGEGWTALARFMDEAGIRGPYDNNGWTAAAAAKIIRNPVYLGQARSGHHVNDSAHAPLVSRTEWEAAQGDRHVSTARNGDGLLLAGLVRCAGCRYLLKPDSMRGRDRERLGLYRCRCRHAAGKCESPASVLARVIDPHVEQEFLAALGSDGPLAEAVQANDAVESALEALQDAERELTTYRDEPGILNALGKERFLAGLETRAEAVRTAQRALSDARQRVAFSGPAALTAGALVEAWPTLRVPERRALLTASIDAVMVRSVRGNGRQGAIGERVHVLWRGEAPDDFPRRGRRVPLGPFIWPDEAPADVRVPVGEHA